jgi:acyl carrier protein
MEASVDARSLRELIAGIGLLDADDLLDDVSLLDQGALDSTGLVELQLTIEDELGRELGPDELDSTTLLTIKGIVDWFDALDRNGA